MKESKDTQAIQADLAHFTGDVDRFQHPLNRHVVYTPGVKYLAEKAQAYWLIDAVASYFGSTQVRRAIDADERIADMHFWTLRVNEDRSATLTARADAGETPFVTQQIEFTDFPMDSISIWAAFDGQRWTLYLPSEH